MRLHTIKSRVRPVATRIAGASASTRLRGRAAMDRTARIKARDLYTCAVCGRVTQVLEVDHIAPLWAGGADVDGNLQCLCVDCHATKTAREAAQRVGAVESLGV